ncbi:SPOR domain-containing protein [Undibacterium squillarum]|uniref:SPOR domain-containing protein n=1 Tax=Undibacterium squillarum TaxID=1131567 RepID=UPI0035B24C72
MGLFSRFKNKDNASERSDGGEFRSRAELDSIDTRQRGKKDREQPARRSSRTQDDPLLPEKKRARRRLIGAAALALAAAVVLPMVLDTEPKPVADDVQIRIPSKDKAPELVAEPVTPSKARPLPETDEPEEIIEPAPPLKSAEKKATAPLADNKPATSTLVAQNDVKAVVADKPKSAELATRAEPKPERKPETRQETRTEPKPERKPEPKPEPKPEVKQEAKAAKAEPAKAERKPDNHPEKKDETKVAQKRASDDETARAMAILEGKSAPAKPVASKVTMQVAALASQEKVDELQAKLRSAGVASYTQKVSTSQGDKIRVRVGPFSSQEEADRVKAKLSGLGLNATVIPN